jgi:hypothetical protein
LFQFEAFNFVSKVVGVRFEIIYWKVKLIQY